MLLGDSSIKREGSQGQNKTYLVALKLAQFDFLKRYRDHCSLVVVGRYL